MNSFRSAPDLPRNKNRDTRLTYAGAHITDADVLVICYRSEDGTDPSHVEQLAQNLLTTAERASVADGLCVVPIERKPTHSAYGDRPAAADQVRSMVSALRAYNTTAACVLSCVDSPEHADTVAMVTNAEPLPSYSADWHDVRIDQTLAVSPGRSARPELLATAFTRAKQARRKRLNQTWGERATDIFDLPPAGDPVRWSVKEEYELFLGSGDPSVLSGHLVDLPHGKAGVALSNRNHADLRLAQEIVCILDRNLTAGPAAALASSEVRVMWAAHPDLDVGWDGEHLDDEVGAFVSALGKSPARLRLRVQSPESLDVVNDVFSYEATWSSNSPSRRDLGDLTDALGNRDRVTIEICGDSPLDPETVARDYGLPVVDRRGTSILASAAEDSPGVARRSYQPPKVLERPVGYARRTPRR